jgi:hypothetical protein
LERETLKEKASLHVVRRPEGQVGDVCGFSEGKMSHFTADDPGTKL